MTPYFRILAALAQVFVTHSAATGPSIFVGSHFELDEMDTREHQKKFYVTKNDLSTRGVAKTSRV